MRARTSETTSSAIWKTASRSVAPKRKFSTIISGRGYSGAKTEPEDIRFSSTCCEAMRSRPASRALAGQIHGRGRMNLRTTTSQGSPRTKWNIK